MLMATTTMTMTLAIRTITVLTLLITHLGLIPTNHTTLHAMTMTGVIQDAQAAIAKASTIITTDTGSTFRDLDRHLRHLHQPKEVRLRVASLVQRVASLVPRVARVMLMGTTTMTMIVVIRTMATGILRTTVLDMDQDTTQDMVMMIGVTLDTVMMIGVTLDTTQDTTQDTVMMIGVTRVLIQLTPVVQDTVQDTGLLVTQSLLIFHVLLVLLESQARPRVARPRVARQREVIKLHQAMTYAYSTAV